MQVTLKEVVATLEKRLGVRAIKVYWREEKSGLNTVVVKGAELKFLNLTSTQVKNAMAGLPQVAKEKYKDRAYRYLLRWEVDTKAIKFRCTLYVYKDGTQNFVFTTTW